MTSAYRRREKINVMLMLEPLSDHGLDGRDALNKPRRLQPGQVVEPRALAVVAVEELKV